MACRRLAELETLDDQAAADFSHCLKYDSDIEAEGDAQNASKCSTQCRCAGVGVVRVKDFIVAKSSSRNSRSMTERPLS